MTSCNLCTNGWTIEGDPCPNGCRDVSLRNIISAIPPQTNAPEGGRPPWPMTPPMTNQMHFSSGLMKTEDLLGLLRLLSVIMAHDPMTAVKLPPLKQAHLEWCDNVLTAQIDEGATDAPHVLLNRALIELQRVVAGVTPVVQTEGGPDHDYRTALYKIMNCIEDAVEKGFPGGKEAVLSDVIKIAQDTTAYD